MDTSTAPICKAFNTAQGCRFGKKCMFKHAVDNRPICQWFNTVDGCRFGSRCRNSHVYVPVKAETNDAVDKQVVVKKKLCKRFFTRNGCRNTFDECEMSHFFCGKLNSFINIGTISSMDKNETMEIYTNDFCLFIVNMHYDFYQDSLGRVRSKDLPFKNITHTQIIEICPCVKGFYRTDYKTLLEKMICNTQSVIYRLALLQQFTKFVPTELVNIITQCLKSVSTDYKKTFYPYPTLKN